VTSAYASPSQIACPAVGLPTTVNVVWTSQNATKVDVYLVNGSGRLDLAGGGGPQGESTASIPCDGTTQRLSFVPFGPPNIRGISPAGEPFTVLVTELRLPF